MDQTDRPLLVYDGECAFCLAWIEYWKQLTGERVAYAPYQSVASSFARIPVAQFKHAVQLILPGEVLSGAYAVLWTLAFAGRHAWLLWAYEHVPGFAWVAETAYQFIARQRNRLWALGATPHQSKACRR